MKKKSLMQLLLITTVSLLLLLSFCESTDNPTVSFNDDILPIFKTQCTRCHFDNASPGNLDLSSYGALMSGNSNHPDNLVVLGYPSQSLLYESIASDEQAILPSRMPSSA